MITPKIKRNKLKLFIQKIKEHFKWIQKLEKRFYIDVKNPHIHGR